MSDIRFESHFGKIMGYYKNWSWWMYCYIHQCEPREGDMGRSTVDGICWKCGSRATEEIREMVLFLNSHNEDARC